MICRHADGLSEIRVLKSRMREFLLDKLLLIFRLAYKIPERAHARMVTGAVLFIWTVRPELKT